MKNVHVEVANINSGKVLAKTLQDKFTDSELVELEGMLEKACSGKLEYLSLETPSGKFLISGDAFKSVYINIIIEKEPKIKGKV